MSRCPSAGILDQALAQRYRLPPRTRGVRADLRVTTPAGVLHHGSVQFGCPRHAATRLVGATREHERWVAEELRTWAQETFARPFAATEGRYEIHVHRAPDGSHLARLADEATGTCFRLRDGRAVQRVRVLGDTRVTTTWAEWSPAEDGRDLPTGQTVEVEDLTTGRTLRREDRRTRWTPLAPHLPVDRSVVEVDDAGERIWRIQLLRPSILLPSGP